LLGPPSRRRPGGRPIHLHRWMPATAVGLRLGRAAARGVQGLWGAVQPGPAPDVTPQSLGVPRRAHGRQPGCSRVSQKCPIYAPMAAAIT